MVLRGRRGEQLRGWRCGGEGTPAAAFLGGEVCRRQRRPRRPAVVATPPVAEADAPWCGARRVRRVLLGTPSWRVVAVGGAPPAARVGTGSRRRPCGWWWFCSGGKAGGRGGGLAELGLPRRCDGVGRRVVGCGGLAVGGPEAGGGGGGAHGGRREHRRVCRRRQDHQHYSDRCSNGCSRLAGATASDAAAAAVCPGDGGHGGTHGRAGVASLGRSALAKGGGGQGAGRGLTLPQRTPPPESWRWGSVSGRAVTPLVLPPSIC